ncbi:MAG: hypothetical protein HRT71_13690 [Flavobacteriales bacterium]|nr:hypothetical protein [Flavobacteriales bacterium]
MKSQLIFLIIIFSHTIAVNAVEFQIHVGVSGNYIHVNNVGTSLNDKNVNSSGIGLFAKGNLWLIKDIVAFQTGFEIVRMKFSFYELIPDPTVFPSGVSKEIYYHTVKFLQWYVPLNVKVRILKQNAIGLFVFGGVAYCKSANPSVDIIQVENPEIQFSGKPNFRLDVNDYGITQQFGILTEYDIDKDSGRKIALELVVRDFFGTHYAYGGLDSLGYLDDWIKSNYTIMFSLGYVF